eukprot:TRINITY_DN1121_c0_g1_i1.p2 TRINITY_DN1121_c0_g1~~TRINITY_DN1121_c0_g1_i1.p2  ORF type:complete len:100 (-),score=19.68 TRINITY_DN1121_c0_g1_i1:886-1185(-)
MGNIFRAKTVMDSKIIRRRAPTPKTNQLEKRIEESQKVDASLKGKLDQVMKQVKLAEETLPSPTKEEALTKAAQSSPHINSNPTIKQDRSNYPSGSIFP